MIKKPTQNQLITPCLMFLHAVLFLYLAPRLNIWLDEAWTFETTARTASEAFTRALQVERQAPLYFAILAAWRGLFGESLFIMRLFSLSCSLGTIAMLPVLARQYLPQIKQNKAGFAFLTASAALNPFLLWASLEARVYALVIFVSALLFYFFYEGFLRRSISTNARIYAQTTYFLLAAVALYINYFLGFLLFANFLILLCLRERRGALRYFGQMILVGILFLPIVLPMREQFAANENYHRETATIVDGIKNAFGFFVSFALPASEKSVDWLFWRMWIFRLAALFLIICGLRRMFKTKRLPFHLLGFGVIVLTVGGFLAANYLALGLRYTQIRHAAPLFLPSLFFTASFIDYALSNRLKTAFFGIFLVFSSAAIFHNYRTLTKNVDWKPLTDFIEANEKTGEPILTFRTMNQVVVRANYRGINYLPPVDARSELWEERSAPNTPERYAPQIEHLIAEIPADARRFWLITEEFCELEESRNECEPLENGLKKHYRVVSERNFIGAKVRLLEKF